LNEESDDEQPNPIDLTLNDDEDDEGYQNDISKKIKKEEDERRKKEIQEKINKLKKLTTEFLQKQEKKGEDVEFRKLTPEELKLIHSCTNSDTADVVIKHSSPIDNAQLSKHDLCSLLPRQWLNDEVINYYMMMLNERCVRQKKKYFCFSTFFYTMYIENGYDRVKRWTTRKKIDIFELDILFIPVHLGTHWCLGVIYMTLKKFEYYDSLGNNNQKFMKSMKKNI